MQHDKIKGLYAITSTRYMDLEDLLTRTEQVLKGGAAIVQFREKSHNTELIVEYGLALRKLCRSYGAPLILNDHEQLVHKIGAAGVHLGQKDQALKRARTLLGPDAIIGVSCYDSMRRAVQAQEHGASYVAFGSVYPSKTKPHATRTPLPLISSAAGILSIPIVATGGIDENNVERVIRAGADAVAVVSSIFDAADPEQAATQISSQFTLDQVQETNGDG